MSGRDRCHALPELQQWESAQVDHYVWGNPAAIDTYGRALDAAGRDLGSVADSLAAVDVSGFWTGAAATAFTQLRDRVVPAVRGLASMHTEAGAALGTWQRHLAVYQEDTAAAITLGRQGWRHYQTSCQAQAAGQATMNIAKGRISDAVGLREGSARTCRTAIEAATAKADVPTQPPAGGQPPATQPGTTTTNPPEAPSGRAPVPFTGPIPPGRERPMVDPANGRVVVPLVGVYAAGQPWPYVYADGKP